MTNGIWSPRLQQFIGFALVSRTCKPGDDVVVHKEGRLMHGTLCDLPFI